MTELLEFVAGGTVMFVVLSWIDGMLLDRYDDELLHREVRRLRSFVRRGGSWGPSRGQPRLLVPLWTKI
jgi:hypothetical protein